MKEGTTEYRQACQKASALLIDLITNIYKMFPSESAAEASQDGQSRAREHTQMMTSQKLHQMVISARAHMHR